TVPVFYNSNVLNFNAETKERQRRYLLFTKATQWGVFATVSVPIHPETLVSAAWFFEANYYNVDNATYFEPLLGDIETTARKKHDSPSHHLTRHHLYTVIESMLERHGYPGRPCLLRAICENAASDPQNGVLGDLLHLALTPSTSLAEDIDDCYYEAEFWGSEGFCHDYVQDCSTNPFDLFSLLV
ncbi:uncharacterized protein LOC121734439, partial [Aricia agestis]|uniref:uncharacterized protein LOC121734439 n=1 Tax=Aricia agestis TaxID=91739 RepID=UPI001C204488